MRKSWVRLSLALVGAFACIGQAAAQASVNFWFNSLGDPSGNQPSVINVNSGSTATLSVYVRTSNIGALSAISMMFGFSTSTTAGSGATPADTNATFNSWSWANAELASNEAFNGSGGGGGPASGTSRPYGRWVNSFKNSGTYAGSGDNLDFHVGDITLNINAAPGTNIPVSVWSFGTTDLYASAVVNGNNVEYFPGQPYNATLHVNAVPEPASLALLGMGAVALLRRRRK